MRKMIRALCTVGALLSGSSAYAQTATVKVPMCLQLRDVTKTFIPCTGVVPVDSNTGNVISWADLFRGIVSSGGGSGVDSSVNTGSPSSRALPVQTADGVKIATDSQLVSANAKLTSLIATLGSPLQAGGTIGNTAFGAKLLDNTGAAFGTSSNPLYVTGSVGGGGGGSTITANAGVSNTSAVPVQSVTGAALATDTTLNNLFKAGQSIGNTTFASTQSGTWNVGILGTPNVAVTSTVLPTNAATSALQTAGNTSLATIATNSALGATAAKQDAMTTALGTPFQAGGNIGNTFFGARLQDASGTALGTSGNPLYVSGGGGSGGSTITAAAGASNTNAVPVQSVDGKALATEATAATLFKAGQSIGNTAFGITGTLPAFATTPTVNIGTAPNLTVGGTVAVSSITNPVAVTGTFYQATQPVSATALPLPTGASSAALQTTGNTSLASIVTNTAGITTALGTPFQAGGSIANSFFGARLQDANGIALGTSGNPLYVSGGTGGSGGGSTITATAGTSNPTAVPVQSVSGAALATDATVAAAFKAGQNIGNTAFGISGTLPAFASTPTVNIGTIPTLSANTLAAVTTAAPTYTNGTSAALSLTPSGALRVDTGGSGGGGSTVTATAGASSGTAVPVQSVDGKALATEATVATLFKSGQSIGNTAFGISGTLPAFASTPTVNLGTAPTLTVNNLASVTTAAPTYTNGSAAALSLTTAGALRVDTGGTTQTVNGTVTVASVTNPVAVTGTFYQATQPVSATALPLPSGASTSALQTSGNTSLTTIATNTTGLATAAKQDALVTALGSPLQAGGNIGNSFFGARLQDSNGTALGTSGNPLYVSGGTGGGGSGGSTVTATAGDSNPTAVPVQSVNGSALATDASVGTLFKAGQNIGNTGFAINGTLPAFATTPTVNIGTTPTLTVNNLAAVTTAAPTYTSGSAAALSLTTSGALRVDTGGSTQSVSGTVAVSSITNPVAVTGTFYQATQPVSATALPLPSGAATSAKQDAMTTALGTPFQAGGSIANTFFGARLQDASGTALGTSGNPLYVSGGGGGGSTVTANAGASSTTAVPVQSVDGKALATETTAATLFKAGQNIGNTTFASTQSGTWAVGLNAGANTIGAVNNLAAVTTTAPTYTTGTNAALSLTTAGALRVDTGGTTQTVNGTVAVSSITNPVAVTGTFYQATQPVSATTLPLPTGAATAAKQDALLAAVGTPVQANTALSNVIQATATDRGALVGTSAITLMAANTGRKGFSVQNQSQTASCYFSGVGTATADYHSLLVGPGGYYEPDHHVGTGAISIICTEASVSIFAREW